MFRKIVYVLFLTLFSLAGQALTLVDDGKANACIVVSKSAPKSVKFAAKELQFYIQKASGATLPISDAPQKGLIPVFIGKNKLIERRVPEAQYKYDQFTIRSMDNKVIISGRDYEGKKEMSGMLHPLRLSESYNKELGINRFGETGTLYGTYEFLRKFLGIRWYMPDELGTVIPQKKTIQIPDGLNISKAPDFEYRFLYNCDFPKDREAALWYRRVGYGAPFPVMVNHTFHLLRKYKDTAPDIFALRGGKPDFKRGCMGMGNLCLSNPKTKELFVEYIREYFEKNPNQQVFPVVPNDSFIEICECPKCQRQINIKKGGNGKFSDYVWAFVNSVASGIAKTNPGKFISCLAYSTYTEAPDIELEPNVVVMICKRRRDYTDAGYKNKIKRMIGEWKKKTAKGNLYFWEYYHWNTSPYLRNIPIFFPDIIADDLKNLNGSSKGEFIESESWYLTERGKEKMHYPGLTHLNYYITAKLMWDSKANVNKLIDEYCRKFYGPAYKPMLKFWKFSAELWQNKASADADYLYSKVYNENNVNLLIRYLKDAEALTGKDTVFRRRIKLIHNEIAPLQKRVVNSRVVNTPQYKCVGTAAPVKLDGVLNDPCWQSAVAVDLVNRDGTTAKYPSTLKFAYDKDALYIGMENFDSATAKLKTKAKADSIIRPYIWEDDSVEVFVNPLKNNDKYYKQFIVNAAGTVLDAEFDGKKNLEQACKWNSGIKTATAVTPDSWVIEIRIPFKDIDADRIPADLKMNIIRNRSCGKTPVLSCWSPTLSGNNSDQKRFGSVVLSGRKESGGDSNVFAKVYEQFKKCRVAEHGAELSYGKIAGEFKNAAELAKRDDLKKKCVYYSTLSYFLAGDYKNASGMCAKLPDSKLKLDSSKLDIEKLLKRIILQIVELKKLQKNITLADYKALTAVVPDVDCGEVIKRLALLSDSYVSSFNEFIEHIRQAVCVGNLKIIGAELYLYAQKHDKCFPLIRNGKTLWPVSVLKSKKLTWHKRPVDWNCPKVGRKGYSYGMNIYISYKYKGKLFEIPNKDKIILLADSVHYGKGHYPHKPNYSGAAFQICGPYEHGGVGTPDRKRHLGGVNVLFVDGHVEWLEADEIPVSGITMLWMGKK